MSNTSDGGLLVQWDPQGGKGSSSEQAFRFIKKDFLKEVADNPRLFRYRENHHVNPDLTLQLHGPFRKLFAVSARSTAVFIDARRRKALTPWQLQRRVFHRDGLLKVDWVLEVDGSSEIAE